MERTEEELDAEASQFAMCLLMPRQLVNTEVDKLVEQRCWDEGGVRRLARTFRVSEGVMTIRFQQLGRINLPLP